MSGYLILGLLLLVSMAWLVLHPFLEPAASGRPPLVLPPTAALAATSTSSARDVAADVAAAPVTSVGPTAAPVAMHATSPEQLRAEIEAAIAARKAAMVRHSCAGCGTTLDAGDAFCRSCGERVKE